LAAVLLAFASWMTVSTALAVLVSRRAEEATQARGAAQAEAQNARASESAAVAAASELAKSNDRLLTSLARSLLGPLADDNFNFPRVPPQLAVSEIEALWELASSSEEHVRVRLVEEALRGPVSTRQLRNRAAYAFQAAVALDGGRRARVEQLLGERLQAEAITPEQERDVALALAQIGIQDSALAGRVARALAQAIARDRTNTLTLSTLAQTLSEVASRLEPKEAAAAITQTMTRMMDPYTPSSAGSPLSHPAIPRRRAGAAYSGGIGSDGHAGLGPRRDAVGTDQGRSSRRAQRQEGGDLDGWMAYRLHYLAEGLSAVAGRMEPKEAAAVSGQAAAVLTQAMTSALNQARTRTRSKFF
jgi:hypothetical protein